ncbi:MAG: trypsin-like peptidase domain-containing protein [Pirellulales bacterium]|nr:trypsin-like peptidase domain-containing protein [Pirellulales bacterium]
MRWAYRLVLMLGICVLLGVGAKAEAKDAVRDSVVKLHVKNRYPDLTRPWTKSNPSSSTGSGVIIDGNRILTNAHVVLYASQVFVQPSQSTEKYPAKVSIIAPGLDLALVTVDDKTFFDGRKALPLETAIPGIKDSVSVYGFPVGGDQLSITKGIVSRIEYSSLQQGDAALRIQVDAAINPGNSGGPAVKDGKIVGLVFGKIQQADNIGYLIAAEDIDRFLKDAADGSYDGIPLLRGTIFQPTENDALREKLGLERGANGLLVWKPSPTNPDYPLKKWDVVTHIGEHPIDQNGMVTIRDDLRLLFLYFVPKEVKDGKVRLKVLRDGKSLDVDVPAPRSQELLVPFLNDKYPRYFVHGPIVFTPVTQEIAGQLVGPVELVLRHQENPMLRRQFDPPAFPGEEMVVVIHRLLPHRVSKGYDGPFLPVVDTINDVKIKNLAQLVEVIRDAKGKFLTVTFYGDSLPLVFRRQELLDVTEEILSDEGIRNQCSPDLEAIWKGEKGAGNNAK